MRVRKINRGGFRLRLRLLFELILYQRLGVRAIPRTDADRLADKAPVAIDQIGKRQAERAVAVAHLSLGIEQRLKCEAQLVEEAPHGFFVLPEIHRHDREPLILVFAVQRFHHWHLFATGTAPCRPKIQKHDLPLELLEADAPAGKIDEREIRRGGIFLWFFDRELAEDIAGAGTRRRCRCIEKTRAGIITYSSAAKTTNRIRSRIRDVLITRPSIMRLRVYAKKNRPPERKSQFSGGRWMETGV